MNVGIGMGVAVYDFIEHCLRLLCRSGIVKINQWLVVYFFSQNWEFGTYFFYLLLCHVSVLSGNESAKLVIICQLAFVFLFFVDNVRYRFVP